MASTEPTLISTVAGTASNAYVSLKYANDYFAPMMEWDDWSAFEDAARMRGIVSATRSIDYQLKKAGAWYLKYDFVDTEQALMFPRSTDYNDSGSLEIPDDVEEATALLALHLLKQRSEPDPMDLGELADKGVRMMNASGVTVITRDTRAWVDWPPNIRGLMAQYIERGYRGITGTGRRSPTIRDAWRSQKTYD